MALLKVLTALAAIAISGTTSTDFESYRRIPSKFLEVPAYGAQDDAELPRISLDLEIPREDAPIPFDTYAAPAADGASAPPADAAHPTPSRDLQAPGAQAWNPDNDPALLYEPPVEISKAVAPTALHPKKYAEAVHEKRKPVGARLKAEAALAPVTMADYVGEQRRQEKAALALAKRQHRKAEKVKQQSRGGFAEPAAAATDHLPHLVGAGRGERVEFQMHGHDGPKSYKWGYDTGVGHNRQFRYEESNNDGYIKGHYGYYDKHGKLRMVHYDSHPHDGFHAEGNVGH